jgi:hypothetical protein
MNEAFRQLHRSARLVRTWGRTPLRSGKTLAETLTIHGAPLWDALAVDLARLLVPEALSQTAISTRYWREFRLHLSWAKQIARGYLRKPLPLQTCPEWPQGPTCLFLGFGSYLYRDALHPVVARMADTKRIATVSLYDDCLQDKTALPRGYRFQSIWQHWNQELEERQRALQEGLKGAILELRRMRALPSVDADPRDHTLFSAARGLKMGSSSPGSTPKRRRAPLAAALQRVTRRGLIAERDAAAKISFGIQSFAPANERRRERGGRMANRVCRGPRSDREFGVHGVNV